MVDLRNPEGIISLLCTIAEDVIPVGHAKIAAAIVYKKEIISIGVCSYQTHPLQKHYARNSESIYLHAEIDAIIKAKRHNIPLSKCDLYVARVKRPSPFSTMFITGLARPCEGCWKAIQEYNIRNVIYTEG